VENAAIRALSVENGTIPYHILILHIILRIDRPSILEKKKKFIIHAVLQIREVYAGSLIQIFSIPDPGFRVKKIPGSRIRIRIKEFKYFNPK
jgi:hypothetical protein